MGNGPTSSTTDTSSQAHPSEEVKPPCLLCSSGTATGSHALFFENGIPSLPGESSAYATHLRLDVRSRLCYLKQKSYRPPPSHWEFCLLSRCSPPTLFPGSFFISKIDWRVGSPPFQAAVQILPQFVYRYPHALPKRTRHSNPDDTTLKYPPIPFEVQVTVSTSGETFTLKGIIGSDPVVLEVPLAPKASLNPRIPLPGQSIYTFAAEITKYSPMIRPGSDKTHCVMKLEADFSQSPPTISRLWMFRYDFSPGELNQLTSCPILSIQHVQDPPTCTILFTLHDPSLPSDSVALPSTVCNKTFRVSWKHDGLRGSIEADEDLKYQDPQYSALRCGHALFARVVPPLHKT